MPTEDSRPLILIGNQQLTNTSGVAERGLRELKELRDTASKTALQDQNEAELLFAEGERLQKGDYSERNPFLAIRFYQSAADLGHAMAQVRVGHFFEYGIGGVTKDLFLALRWYRGAGVAGLCSLARMYLLGRGVDRDPVEARRLYMKAAEEGDGFAKVWIGLTFENGEGVEQDDLEARRWFLDAAELGYGYAYADLARLGDVESERTYARLSETGQGVVRNLQEAARGYRTAGMHGHAGKKFDPSLMFAADPTIRDFADAARCYREEAREYSDLIEDLDQSDQDLFDFALKYEEGTKYTEPDFAEAACWYWVGAENGHARSQTRLGLMYLDERIAKNEIEAIRLLRAAAEQGDADAENALAELNKSRRI